MPTNLTGWTNENEGAEKFKIVYKPTEDTQARAEEMEKLLNFSWNISAVQGIKTEAPADSRRLSETKDANNTQVRDFYRDYDELELQLNFEEPLYVSMSPLEMDKITIEVLPEMFKYEGDLNYTTTIDGQEAEDNVLEVKVPRQINSAEQELLESATSAIESSVYTVALSNIVLSIFFAGLLQLLWGLINTIQMIMLTALFTILLPQNA